MAEIDRLHARLRRLAQAIAAIGVGVLLLQAFAIVLDAASRWLFSTPLYGMEDVNTLLIGATVTSFLPALFMERGNVTIDILGRSLSPYARTLLDLFGQLLAFVFIAGLAWQYADYATDLDARHSVILELPKRPAAWASAALIALAAVLQAVVVAVSFARLKDSTASGVEEGGA